MCQMETEIQRPTLAQGSKLITHPLSAPAKIMTKYPSATPAQYLFTSPLPLAVFV